MLRKAVLFTALAVALSACGTQAPPPVTASDAVAPVTAAPVPVVSPASPQDAIKQFIEALKNPTKLYSDLDDATAYATAQKEPLGQACFPAVKAWVKAMPPFPGAQVATNISNRPPPSGVVTAFEYALVDRTVTESSVAVWQTQITTLLNGGSPTALKLACGGLVQDQLEFVTRVNALLGVAVVTGGNGPAAGAIIGGVLAKIGL